MDQDLENSFSFDLSLADQVFLACFNPGCIQQKSGQGENKKLIEWFMKYSNEVMTRLRNDTATHRDKLNVIMFICQIGLVDKDNIPSENEETMNISEITQRHDNSDGDTSQYSNSRSSAGISDNVTNVLQHSKERQSINILQKIRDKSGKKQFYNNVANDEISLTPVSLATNRVQGSNIVQGSESVAHGDSQRHSENKQHLSPHNVNEWPQNEDIIAGKEKHQENKQLERKQNDSKQTENKHEDDKQQQIGSKQQQIGSEQQQETTGLNEMSIKVEPDDEAFINEIEFVEGIHFPVENHFDPAKLKGQSSGHELRQSSSNELGQSSACEFSPIQCGIVETEEIMRSEYSIVDDINTDTSQMYIMRRLRPSTSTDKRQTANPKIISRKCRYDNVDTTDNQPTSNQIVTPDNLQKSTMMDMSRRGLMTEKRQTSNSKIISRKCRYDNVDTNSNRPTSRSEISGHIDAASQVLISGILPNTGYIGNVDVHSNKLVNAGRVALNDVNFDQMKTDNLSPSNVELNSGGKTTQVFIAAERQTSNNVANISESTNSMFIACEPQTSNNVAKMSKNTNEVFIAGDSRTSNNVANDNASANQMFIAGKRQTSNNVANTSKKLHTNQAFRVSKHQTSTNVTNNNASTNHIFVAGDTQTANNIANSSKNQAFRVGEPPTVNNVANDNAGANHLFVAGDTRTSNDIANINTNSHQVYRTSRPKDLHNKFINPTSRHSMSLGSNQTINSRVRRLMCKLCGQRFEQKGHLRYHLRMHSGEKPFVCHECGKGFRSNSTLKVHILTHSGEKRYQCPWCDRRFTTNSYLKIHKRDHTGEQPYACEHCGRGFKSRSHLVYHSPRCRS